MAVEHDLVWEGCLVAKPVRTMCVVASEEIHFSPVAIIQNYLGCYSPLAPPPPHPHSTALDLY